MLINNTRTNYAGLQILSVASDRINGPGLSVKPSRIIAYKW